MMRKMPRGQISKSGQITIHFENVSFSPTQLAFNSVPSTVLKVTVRVQLEKYIKDGFSVTIVF